MICIKGSSGVMYMPSYLPSNYVQPFEDCLYKDCTTNPPRKRIQEVTEVKSLYNIRNFYLSQKLT